MTEYARAIRQVTESGGIVPTALNVEYARDAVSILRQNGSKEHADAIAALLAELERLRYQVEELRTAVQVALDIEFEGGTDFEQHGFTSDRDIEALYRRLLAQP